jgi:hypothetical protein
VSGKNGGLELLEGRALQARPAFVIFKPLRSLVPMARQPRLQLGALAVGLLAFRGRYANIDASAYAR